MKRFTETNKWRDPWFRLLSPTSKLLWSYLCDCCDNSGVAELDLEAFSFFIGSPVTQKNIDELGDRIVMIKPSKIWIPKFVKFQFGDLCENSRVHLSVYALLCEHGLDDRFELSTGRQYPRKRVTQTFRKRIMELDKYQCQWCGNAFKDESLILDHVVPVIIGGSNDENNVVTCCVSCNSSKRDRHPLEFAKGKHPLDRLSNILHTISNALDTPKEKEKVQEKEKDQIGTNGVNGKNSTLDPPMAVRLVELLRTAYGRKQNAMLDYYEEHTIHEIVSTHPEAESELLEMLKFRERNDKFFPKSITGLLASWNKTLDRSRQNGNGHSEMSEADKHIALRELAEIEKRQGSIRAGYSEHQSWSEKDLKVMNALKARRTELRESLKMSTI